MNPNIFREYDIRGLADEDLTDENVEKIGKAFGTYMARSGAKRLTVGRDIRLSSERIRNAIISGIASTGCDVIDVGVLPTPVFYFSILHCKADGGVMVTGSHNPIEYNGLKLCRGIASVYGEEIQKLRKMIEKGDYEKGEGKVESQEVIPAYLKTLKEKLRFAKGSKVVIDAGNGTAGMVAPQLLEDLGCRVIPLYCEPDGRFPNHLPDPTIMKYIQDLRRKVVEEGADVGIGYDGDADRIGVIDDKGRVIFADVLLALFSQDLLGRQKGAKVVFDIKCSQGLPAEIQKYGGHPLMWKTGHSLLKAKMKEEKAPLAGEMSGHMFFADDYFGFDDAIYASGRFLQLLSQADKNLSQLVEEIPFFSFYSTPEIRVECSEEDKFDIVRDILNHFQRRYQTINIDGVKVLFDEGWGLVRASNTQPVLVLRFEAKTRKGLEEIIDIFKSKLKEYPSVKIKEGDFKVFLHRGQML